MAELNLINPSLIDILSQTGVDGNIARLIELAEKLNPVVEHATYVECNNGTKHQHNIRLGIPEPAFRRYNQHILPSKSTSASVEDTTGMIEDYLEVDKALADLKGRAAQFRMNETIGKIQGFNNFVVWNMFYGSTAVTPEGFMGLDARYNDPTAPSGRQIIDGGGTGSDNASVWFVTWGGKGTNLIYPEGSTVGFQHRNLGEQTSTRDNGGMMQVYRDHYKWDVGMALGDWRANARVANIDVSALTKDASAGADLLDLMIDAEEMIDTAAKTSFTGQGELVQGKTVIYAPRVITKFLRKQALNKTNVNLTVEQVAGKRVTMWGEHEVHPLDVLSTNEAAIPFA